MILKLINWYFLEVKYLNSVVTTPLLPGCIKKQAFSCCDTDLFHFCWSLFFFPLFHPFLLHVFFDCAIHSCIFHILTILLLCILLLSFSSERYTELVSSKAEFCRWRNKKGDTVVSTAQVTSHTTQYI